MKDAGIITYLCLFVAIFQVSAFCINNYDISLPSYAPGTAIEDPAAINDLNQIVGPSMDLSFPPAYLWQNGTRAILPIPDEGEMGNFAHDINNAGHYVGAEATNRQGKLWNGTEMVDLGTLGGSGSIPFALNEADQVVGGSATLIGNQTVPFLWQNDSMVSLGTLGGNYGKAFDINNQGIIVGFSHNVANKVRAFIYKNQAMTDLGTLGGAQSSALAINDANEIVGISETAGGFHHAFLWKNGQMTDLGTLGGGQSQAFDINNSGQILGWAETATGYRPLVVWENGQAHRLNELIAADSGWELVIRDGIHIDNRAGYRINNTGAILGKGFINQGQAPFLMIPRPDDFLLHDSNRDGTVNMQDYLNFSEEWLK